MVGRLPPHSRAAGCCSAGRAGLPAACRTACLGCRPCIILHHQAPAIVWAASPADLPVLLDGLEMLITFLCVVVVSLGMGLRPWPCDRPLGANRGQHSTAK